MAVRNWWIDAEIDGRQTDLAGGPRRTDGGFNLRLYQRDDGAIRSVLYLRGQIGPEGQLLLRGTFNGESLMLETKR